MIAILNGQEVSYSQLTWAQLCDERLLIVNDGVPDRLPDETLRDRDNAVANLMEFCEDWRRGWLARIWRAIRGR